MSTLNAPSWVRFVRATEWGVHWTNPPQTETLSDPETYVHHTAGNTYQNIDAFDAMRTLQAMSHRNGYSTVAYDVVCHLHTNGTFTVMGGREGWRSAATKDRNEEGEAICMMGYYHPGSPLSTQPPAKVVEGLAWGILWMIEQGWSASTTRILGHRDNPKHPNATACPGDHLYAQLPTIRDRVSQLLNPPTPPTQPETDDMQPTCYHRDTRMRGTFANVAGRWIPWNYPIPNGARFIETDHPWTREQILHDQGETGAALWRERMK